MRHFHIRHARRIEPTPPMAAVIEVQQRHAHEIGRLAQPIAAGHQLGATDREELLGAKAHHIEPRPVAFPMTDREIHLLAGKIDVMQCGGDSQINVGMRFREMSKPVDEPFRREIRGRADGQDPELWRCTTRAVPSAMRSKASRKTAR